MKQSIEYRVEAHRGGDCDNLPNTVVFHIEEATARVIAELASLIESHDLYRIEKWDHRARFLQFDPQTEAEDAVAAGEENDVRTECDRLVVSATEFGFAAYIKHTDIEVTSDMRPIAEVLEHFGLPPTVANEPVIYLTNACGEPTGQGTVELTEADYAKVAFENGPGFVLPYLVQIAGRKHVLGNLEIAYRDPFWGDEAGQFAPEQEVRAYCDAICAYIRARLPRCAKLLPLDDRCEGRLVVGVAVGLDALADRDASTEALASIFGPFGELAGLGV